MENLKNKIIDFAHKQGLRFTFDTECQVKGCTQISEWVQEITHEEAGKLKLELCNAHMSDFDNDQSIIVEVEAVQD